MRRIAASRPVKSPTPAGSIAGADAAGAAGDGPCSNEESPRRIAASSERSGSAGSMPSSAIDTSRARRYSRSASACRPAPNNASMSWLRICSRSG
ncbi:hypothetical protein DMP14_13475 [Pseudonocardia sp. Ae707_Ps2]